MYRLIVLPALAFFAGTALLLSRTAYFSRRPLVDRLRPYSSRPGARSASLGMFSAASFREVIAPIAHSSGERIAALFGVSESIARRLERVHSPIAPVAFRLRQLGFSLAAFTACVLCSAVAQPPLVIAALLCVAAPLLAFLVLEQRATTRSKQWQEQLFDELPVVAEQIGLLIGAGFSLGSALARIARRGSGASSADLQRVVNRIQQGLSENAALREWADLAGVEAVRQLVNVLALNREAGDLGRLIAEEARSARREAQRHLIERIERKGQQVWIPVTAATLLPGVVFMAVPFMDALTLFSGS